VIRTRNLFLSCLNGLFGKFWLVSLWVRSEETNLIIDSFAFLTVINLVAYKESY